MVTLRSIAEATGYSKTTVWMSFNGNPRIPEKTRVKILSVAKEMGYSPNPAYREMLKQVRAGQQVRYNSTIGLIHSFDIPDPEDHDPYHHELVSGAVERATELGYKVEKFWSHLPNLNEHRLSQILHARGIQGIIITPMVEHATMDLEWDKFAAVTIGYTLTEPRLNRIEVNNPHASALCLKKLLENGYRKIGLVMRPEHEALRQYELSAPYLWMQSNLPVDERSEPLLIDATNPGEFFNWLDNYKFDSIVTTHSCIVDWLLERGFDIPGDIGIVFPTPVYDYTDFAHVNQQPHRIGMATTDMLVAQMNNREWGCPQNPKTMRTDVAWMDGPSIRQVGPMRGDPLLDSML